MPNISHSLIERICESLDDGPLLEEIKALAHPVPNSNVTVSIPSHLLPYVSYALMVGATTMRMNGHKQTMSDEMYEISKTIKGEIPPVFAKVSDTHVEKMFSLARSGGVKVTVEKELYADFFLSLVNQDNENVLWGPLVHGLEKSEAEQMAAQMNEYLENLADLGEEPAELSL